MKGDRFLRWAFAGLLALASASPAGAEGWGDFWRKRPPPAAPCVLDECLNGGGTQNPPPASPGDRAAPRPGEIAPGAFDYYLLTLSWSPGFCDTGGDSKAPDQCEAGSGLGFVVHGLWPQYAHGYPQDCDGFSRPVSRSALALARGVFPDESLARYEWRKHGTCTGLSPEGFFATVRRARDSIAVPEAFKAPRQEQSFAPRDIERAFIAVNPGLRFEAMAVTCRSGELQDVRLCLTKDLRSFVNCPEVARRSCRAPAISVAPVR
ncbi:MAG TPA: ribonuclease T2 [Roseiarcus sp.]|nr:ribonuclease T2 [Roseiarcus sp.]